ncbi:MAG: hypothetical protein ACXWX9_03075 [Actinomycetota bacterium]
MPEIRSKTGSARRAAGAGPEPPAPEGDADGARGLVCNVAVCPICLTVTAAQGAAPDAMEHLLKAAREFFLAARAVIDARADHLEGEGEPRATRLQKIDIA